MSLKHRCRISEDAEAPVVFLVHGRAGDESVMWAFKNTIPEQYTIFSPQAFTPDPIGGFSWWRIDQDNFGTREYALERLRLFFDQALAAYELKPKKIIALGFSQGAALLSLMIHREPYRLDGVGLLAGFCMEGRPDLLPDQPPKTEVFIAHGTNDSVIPIAKAYRGRDHLESLGFSVEFLEDPVEHKIGSIGMRGLKAWLRAFGAEH